jgi:hypothetical protein
LKYIGKAQEKFTIEVVLYYGRVPALRHSTGETKPWDWETDHSGRII